MKAKTIGKQKIKCIRCKKIINILKRDAPRISTKPYCNHCYGIKKCERKTESKLLV